MTLPESHLAQEAIAALVDGELPAGAASRAARHLEGCLQCRMAVQAQREAKDALHGCEEVSVPGDLVSRLYAIPFTADVRGAGAAAWDVDLTPNAPPHRPGHARWLRRGLAGTLAGLGAGVTVLALQLPAGDSDAPAEVADSGVREHTEVVPPVLRAVNTGTSPSPLGGTGGTP
ncbi:zf-HC2 domain-containing protein [Blastococcus sp. CCUG 61487]|uniref:anti-sigma factor family protein n=1 Tax=Blastococcus sp. CCUG 61487 TaxID=1840703 RepID=UPI0010C01170|nr:zf-HC2 domain-containing protein [Blastococcus sp. CCUG 61487]TKJ35547.1 hypothetical protein A6V29_14215 [Blastococcus sp. CCUG 61487]